MATTDTVPLTNFLSRVRTAAPLAPEEVLLQAIRDACIAFCGETGFWRFELADVTLTTGTASYTLTLPSGTELAYVQRLRHNGQKVTPADPDELDETRPLWDEQTGDQVCEYVMDDRDVVRLIPIPTGDTLADLKGRVALQPAQDATEVYHRVYDDHAETIAAGAKARLYEMPEAPWYNPNLAERMRALFRAGRQRAKHDGERHYNRRRTKHVRGVYF